MKVALYTIFRCTNYGAVLQAIALARSIRRLVGEDGLDVLNHRMDPRDNHLLGKITNPETPWFQRWRNRRKFSKRYYAVEQFELRRVKTIRVIERLLRPTEHLYRSPDELKEIPPYRTVVVGSDQIWNPLLNTDFGHNQYLCTDFPENQDRVSYAGSFGLSKFPGEFIDTYRAALERFRVITCREESGSQICEQLIGSRPEVVLDPTMLLTECEWRELMTNRETVQQTNITAAYWVKPLTESDIKALSAYAKAQNCKVHLMSAGPMAAYDFPSEIIPVVNADPLDFLAEIASAQSVVTDSFHGLQFATKFQKPVAALAELKGPHSNSSRLTDFVNRYAFPNCINDISDFRNGQPLIVDNLKTFSNESMERDRIRSLSLLKNMLNLSNATDDIT